MCCLADVQTVYVIIIIIIIKTGHCGSENHSANLKGKNQASEHEYQCCIVTGGHIKADGSSIWKVTVQISP